MEVSGQFHTAAALPLGKSPFTHSVGGWVDPRGGLDDVEYRKISYLCRESNHGRPARRASLCRLIYPVSLVSVGNILYCSILLH
jgi:hypothetical protein